MNTAHAWDAAAPHEPATKPHPALRIPRHEQASRLVFQRGLHCPPVADDTTPLQESMERSTHLGQLLFPSPPRILSYGVMLLMTLAATVLLGATPSALLAAIVLVLAPAVLTSLASPWIANLLGRTYYHRRAALVNAASTIVLTLGLLATVLAQALPQLGFLDGNKLVYTTIGFAFVGHYASVTTIVDNRLSRALPLSALYPLLTLPGLVGQLGAASLPVGLLLWVVLVAPVVLLSRIFDAPLMRNFGVSGAELFRSYLDHMTTQSVDAEELLSRIGEPVQAPVGAIAFKRSDGSKKACIVVPCVHPGPFGALGGGDLPAKIRNTLHEWEHVLVPHAAADHDLNPVTSQEVERLGHYVSSLVDEVKTQPGGSTFVERGDQVRLGGQAFGSDVLLTYTSWPEAIDDVDQGVGHATELVAKAKGARHALFVDCHNSLRPSAGAVYPLTPRALEVEALGGVVAEACLAGRVSELRVGCAQDTTLGLAHLVGRAGCQVLVVEAGEQRTAYVLWDANNMVPEATRAIREAVLGVVDEVRVMTTDNHAVNLEGGTYSALGLRTDHGTLARISKDAVVAALGDLEGVQAGAVQGHAPDIRVVGHQRTAQLAASVNVMVSIVPELVAVCLGLWTLGLFTVFLAF